MEVMIKEYATSFLRNAGAPIIVWLAATGYLTESEAANFVLASAAVVVAVGWGLMNKYLWKNSTTKTALQHPATSDEKTLQDVISNT